MRFASIYREAKEAFWHFKNPVCELPLKCASIA